MESVEIGDEVHFDRLGSLRGAAATSTARNSPTSSPILRTHKQYPQQQQQQSQTFGFEEQEVLSEDGMGSLENRPRAGTALAYSSPFAALQVSRSADDSWREVATWPKHVCRVRNRFGALEGKLLCLSPPTTTTSLDTWEMRFFALSRHDSFESEGGNANNEEEFYWSLKPRDLVAIRILGFNGCWLQLALSSNCTSAEMTLRFETPAWRSHFIRALPAQLGDITRQTYPGGEDCVLQEVSNGSSGAGLEFKRIGLIKGLTGTQYARTLVFMFPERQLWEFRAQDLFEAQSLLDCCQPYARHAITEHASLEMTANNAGKGFRCKLVLEGSNATDSSSASASASAAAPANTSAGLDLVFPTLLERERFGIALQTMARGTSGAGQQQQLLKPPVLPAAAKLLRTAWKKQRPELKWFSTKRSVFIGTFNVGDAPPPSSEVLELWIPRARNSNNGSAYALHVIGLQECNKFEEWTRALHAHLGGNSVCLVTAVKLWEIGLIIFAAQAERITSVETSSVATGLGIAKEVTGVQLGNKGGVACALRWNDTSLCFINCHLPAHQEKAKERCANFVQIASKLGLAPDGTDVVHAFDHVFVLGDLNFRVDETFAKVVSLSSQAKFAQLLEMDQLGKEFADAESCFHAFRDVGPIDFPPTYRWEKTRQAFSNKRDQPPSYTDRILVHSRDAKLVHCAQYVSAHDCMISDHRPVSASLVLELREPFMQWPHHPLLCQVRREMEMDEGAKALLGIRQQMLAAPVPAHSPSNAAVLLRKTSKQQEQQQQPLLHQQQQQQQDQDEEDEPTGPFLGEFGSFVAPSGGSSIDLVECNLKLDIGVPSNRDTVLRSASPRLILEDYEQRAGEATTMYQVEYLWKDGAALRMRPLLFDPIYLASQHLVLAIEHRPSKRTAAAATATAAAAQQQQQQQDDEPGLFDQQQPPKRSTLSAALRRNKNQNGSQHTGAASALLSGGNNSTLVGHICIPLAALAVGQDVSVESPVMNNLVRVGHFTGKLRVQFGSHEEQRKQVVSARTAGAAEFCLRTQEMDVFQEDKWRRAFVALDSAGVLYVSIKLPTPSALAKQSLQDFLQKNAVYVCDMNNDRTRIPREEETTLLPVNESRPCCFDLITQTLPSSPGNAGNAGAAITLCFACAHESTKLAWQSVLDMFLSVRRYAERDFIVDLQRAMKERITDRIRRRELEQEIQRKNAELLAKREQDAAAAARIKPSFIARVLDRKASWFVRPPVPPPAAAIAAVEEGASSSAPPPPLVKAKSLQRSTSNKLRTETVAERAQREDAAGAGEEEASSTTTAVLLDDRLRERARNIKLKLHRG